MTDPTSQTAPEGDEPLAEAVGGFEDGTIMGVRIVDNGGYCSA